LLLIIGVSLVLRADPFFVSFAADFYNLGQREAQQDGKLPEASRRMKQKLFKVKNVPAGIKPYSLLYPCEEQPTGNKAGRALIITRAPTAGDLELQCSPSGSELDLLRILIKESGFKGSWLAMPFEHWKTDRQDSSSKELWYKHVKNVASAFNADRILCLDLDPFVALVDPEVVTKGYLNGFAVGNIFESRLKAGIKVGLSLPLSDMIADNDFKGNGETNLMGFQLRACQQVLLQRHQFAINLETIRPRVVKSLKDFETMMAELEAAKTVAIDTETDGLQVRQVQMLTIQFATDPKRPWLLPFLHRDSVWTSGQLDKIKRRLATWFETSGSDCHIYMNSTFDLPVIRANIGYRYYKTPIWDVAMGEHNLDENMVFINEHYRYLLGSTRSVYTLANIAATYWCWPYLTGLGKQNRKHIADLPLNDDVIMYAVTDVSLPLMIYRRQNERATAIGYTTYRKLMLTTESDKHHAFAVMRWNGIPCDISYVQYLSDKKASPIYQEIEKHRTQIIESPAAQKCNRLLAKNRGFSSDLFGGHAQTFRLNVEKHKQLLFFDVLGLKPLRETKNGGGSLDKEFKKHYGPKVPEVAALNEIDAYEKLLTTYVHKVRDLYQTDKDLRSDACVRPRFSPFLVTGRISESDPNMQQIPKKGRGLIVKRMYVAPKGYLVVKADYKAHEVRGWGIISQDPELAAVFNRGIDLIDRYRDAPSEKRAKEVYLYACPHRQNVHNVHGIDLAKTDPKKVEDLRDEIKGLTFGPIYGKGVSSMAKTLGKPEDYVRSVLKKMFGRFALGNRWLKDIERQALQQYFVEAPTGRRRNLMAVKLLPESAPNRDMIINAIKRKARNSPIQGMCSDVNLRSVRSTDTFIWKLTRKGREVGIKTANVVHDSQETFVRYEDFWLALKMKEYSMVTEAGNLWNRDCSSNLGIRFEIDMEVGSDYANMFKWDWSYDSLIKALCKTLVLQRLEVGHDFDPQQALKLVMSRFKEDAPKWLVEQANKTVNPKELLATMLKEYKLSAYAQSSQSPIAEQKSPVAKAKIGSKVKKKLRLKTK
jgi:DNA polymerase I-like protein with 3'-5' exonuclease and polymerase domains